MPKFNGQNKKRIDPRYFLQEQPESFQIIVDRLCSEGVPKYGGIKGVDEEGDKMTVHWTKGTTSEFPSSQIGLPLNVFVKALQQKCPKAFQAGKRRARRRGAVYARGPAVGKIQGLLLKAFGVSQVAESRMLSEATIPSVLGSKNIDQKLGATTLKSLQKIPALKNFVDDPSDVRHPRFIRKILKILQKCSAGGFKDPRCKPAGVTPAGRPESATP